MVWFKNPCNASYRETEFILMGFSFLSFQMFKSLHVQLEMRRKQLEQSLQSTQRDGILTVDQALVKQAWERVSKTVREAGDTSRPPEYRKLCGYIYCVDEYIYIYPDIIISHFYFFILASEHAPTSGQVPASSSRYGGSLVAWDWRSTATRGCCSSSTWYYSKHCSQSSRAPKG